VIHFIEDEDFGIAGIAGHEESHDLAAAVFKVFIAAGQAGDDDVNIRRMLPLPYDVLPRTILSLPLTADTVQQLTVLVTKCRELLQFPD
jgi:hypothetical protein